MMKYNLGIIGGGPAGYVAAEKASKKGLKTILFDRKKLGGVCLNEGCIPTKTLLHSAKILDYFNKSEYFGIVSGDYKADFQKIMKRKAKIVKKLVSGVGTRMKKAGVEFINAKATIEERNVDAIIINAGGQSFECENILVCTGSEAAFPPIKGLDKERVLTNREILELDDVPERLVIVGGGVVGVEFADIFNSFGSDVTVIEMLDEIIPGSDKQMAEILRNELNKKGVKFMLNARVNEIDKQTVKFEASGESGTLEFDQILISTGRKPTTDQLGLENIGVETVKGAIKTDHHCRTNIHNVYAAGDVNGFSLLAHTASREGEVVVNNLTGYRDVMRYNAIPYVIYTNPEFSGVGMTEDEAKKKGVKYIVKSLPNVYAGRFMVENERFSGLTKLIFDARTKQLLGFHMVGNPSSEMVYGAAMAIEMQMRMNDLDEIVFPHPTVSEIFKETINS